MDVAKERAKMQAYAIKREQAAIRRRKSEDRAFNKRVDAIYKDLRSGIQDEIYRFMGRYADKNGITLGEANRRIDAIDYRRTLRVVEKMNLRGDLTAEQKRQLDNLNITSRLTRMEALLENVNLSLIDTYGKLETTVGDYIVKSGESELRERAKVLSMEPLSVERINRDIKTIARADFHAADFSDRIWSDKKRLKSTLEQGITKSVIRGQNPKQWKRELYAAMKDTVDYSEYAARRIAITESARVQGEITRECFEASGYNFYEYIAEPTACPVCADLDGQVFKVAKAMPGENYFPMHPFCKCGAAAHYKE